VGANIIGMGFCPRPNDLLHGPFESGRTGCLQNVLEKSQRFVVHRIALLLRVRCAVTSDGDRAIIINQRGRERNPILTMASGERSRHWGESALTPPVAVQSGARGTPASPAG